MPARPRSLMLRAPEMATSKPEVDAAAPGKPSLAQRLRHELREYAIVAAYLYVCLVTVLLYRVAVLGESGEVTPLPFGLAAVKALILGKFVMVGQAVGIGSRGRARSLLHLIARKSLLLWLLLVVLSVLEELVAGLVHGRALTTTLAEYGARSGLELFASSLMMLLILIPFVAVSETSQALGPGVLMRTLLKPPGGSREPDLD